LEADDMSTHDNLTEDRERYQPLPSFAQTYGEDLGPDPFADAAGTPRSAQQHAARRKAQELEAREARDLAQLGAVAQDQADSEALDRAVALIRAGRKVPTQTRIAAMRAARDRGVPISSAELLAAGRG
jgi:hypothetical protein